jgi:hypothetical protein
VSKTAFTSQLVSNIISDDVLAKLVKSDIVSALAEKFSHSSQHSSQQIREFWLEMCSDLAKRGEDT